MVEFFGTTKASTTENGQQVTVFQIPAFSAALARRRARVNSRLKGLENAEIESVTNIGSGDTPGQSVFEVSIISTR